MLFTKLQILLFIFIFTTVTTKSVKVSSENDSKEYLTIKNNKKIKNYMTSENESHSEEKTKKDKKHKKSKVTTQITMFNKTIPFDTTTKMGQILLSTLKINNLVKDSTVNKVTTKKTDIIYTKITTTKKLVTIETSTKTPKIENIINLTSPEITKKVQLFPEITTTKPTIYYISETPNNIFLKTKIINN